MKKKTNLYLALALADEHIANVLQAYLNSTDFAYLRSAGKASASDIYARMSNADAIILIDSIAFREQHENWELQYAQMLHKPLIVISLDQRVDESRSNAQFKLFDFTSAKQRNWQAVIQSIVDLLVPLS